MNSSKSHHESVYDSVEDFKASFICTTNSIRGYIESFEELILALQGCGRNPSNDNVQRYWKRYHRKIGIEEFCEIAYNEQKISEKEIIEAFKLFDKNNDGFITNREFINVFTKEREALSQNEAKQLLAEADMNKDNKLNYREFAKLVINTLEKAKKHARKRMRKIMAENYEEDVRIKSKIKDDDYYNKHHSRSHDHYNDDRNRLHSPIQKSRHSSFSLNNHEHDIDNKRKSNSRLSFADEINDDRHRHDYLRKKSNNDGMKNMLKNELVRARSNDSLRSNKRESKYYDSDDDKHDRRRGRNNFDESERHRHNSKERIRESSRSSRHDKDDSFNHEKENKAKRIVDGLQLYELKFQPINKIADQFKEPKNLKRWTTKSIKGGYYFNENLSLIQSNSYALDINSDSTVFFSIEPYKTPLHTNSELFSMDMSLLIVKDGKKLTLKGLTENKLKNKWCTLLDLKQGRYFLFPFTSGCHLKKRVVESNKNVPSLFKDDVNNKRTLSRQFKDALSVMFDLCDLDSNGRLSQDELNFYTILTSNETLMDDDWKFVGETVGFEKNELTKDGFIKLYKMEAKRDDTDIKDILTRLSNMGFNKSLTIDQSCPYKIEVSIENENFDILLGEIYNTKSAEEFLHQIIEAKGNAKPIKGFEDVVAFEYHNNYWSVIEVLNQSRNDLIVEVNCAKSENCVSNIRDMISSQKLKSNRSKIFMFLSSNNPNKEWVVRCNCNIQAAKNNYH